MVWTSGLLSHATASARSHGSHADQSSNPAFSTCSISRRAEARAVDEQIAFDAGAILEDDRLDEAGLAILGDVDDAAFRAHHALRLGHAAQVAGVQARIELEGIS